MPDTPTGETANAVESKTTVAPVTTPAVNVTDNAQVEQLRKEAEQSRMRANQLQNQIDEAKKAEDARQAKQLEEQNEFKSLYEQTNAKLEAIQNEATETARQKELNDATQTLLGEFSQEVVEIAKEAGMSLTDTTEEAQAALKTRLTNIQSRVVKDAKPSPNNPNPNQQEAQGNQLIEQMRYGDAGTKRNAKNTLINGLSAVKEMKRQAGYSDS